MSSAPLLATRRAIVAALKADAALTALVPAGRIFGEKSKSNAWPFVRCSEFEGGPLYSLAPVAANIHAFSKSAFSDEAHQLIEAIGAALDGTVLELADGRRAHVQIASTRVMQDPDESSAWHGVASIAISIPKDCTER